ncbi:MAG: hypothetical protein CMM50_18440 [Rhodospirillaceae bacterium]|nr:hypothetical protein [Rhodospirillaceae bacterium]|tara:strand:- start:22 stop:543 length:522 start_codon:yes stop_codon:yes gene_type:complete
MKIIPLAAAALSACLSISSAGAQEQRVIGEYRDWVGVTYQEDGKDVCYIYSFPKSEEGDYTRRGPAYVQVTRRVATGAKDVVSFEAGYPYDQDSNVTVSVDGGNRFELFTHPQTPETAWAPDDSTDKALVEAMRKGVKMTVRGRSSRGTDTSDSYSLLGFTDAHQAIAKACGG